MARVTAARSAASSTSVELTKTRKRRSGVVIASITRASCHSYAELRNRDSMRGPGTSHMRATIK